MAFWLTMELADEASRQADLDLLDYFVSVYQQLQGHSERYGMISDLMWPDVLLARAGREQVNDLHAWAEAVGREKAVDIAIEVLRRAEGWDREQILAELERLSGVPVGEGRQ